MKPSVSTIILLTILTLGAFTYPVWHDSVYVGGGSSDSDGGAQIDNTGAITAESLVLETTPLAVTSGGTGAADAATARANLGLAIGTNVQAWDAALDDISGLAVTDGNFVVGDGTHWVAESGATARTSLGLGSIATQDANNVAITGGSISGITDLAVADGGTGASDAATARTNLGLGSIATQDAKNVAITGGSISGITDLAVADGGTGASDATTARTNLGLGTTDTPQFLRMGLGTASATNHTFKLDRTYTSTSGDEYGVYSILRMNTNTPGGFPRGASFIVQPSNATNYTTYTATGLSGAVWTGPSGSTIDKATNVSANSWLGGPGAITTLVGFQASIGVSNGTVVNYTGLDLLNLTAPSATVKGIAISNAGGAAVTTASGIEIGTVTSDAASGTSYGLKIGNVSGKTAYAIYTGNGAVRFGGDASTVGDLAVNGGDITSSEATFNLLNTGVSTLNIGGTADVYLSGATKDVLVGSDLRAGTDDTTQGVLYCYGNNTAGGGGVYLYNSADEDTTTERWLINANDSLDFYGDDTKVLGLTEAGDATLTGDLAINGGDITSSADEIGLVTSASKVSLGHALGTLNVPKSITSASPLTIKTVGTMTLDANYGASNTLVDVLSSAGARCGLRWSGSTIHVPSDTISVDASTGITGAMVSAYTLLRVQGGGSKSVDITTNPQIADGADGQELKIQGDHDTYTVKFDDGTGLALAGNASVTLGKGDMLVVSYDSGDDIWYEISRSNN